MLRAVSVDFPETWKSLKDVVYKLIRCEHVDRQKWNSSFSDVYSLCSSSPVSHASTLYKSTTALVTERLEEIATELEHVSDSELLPSYIHHWENFHKGLTYLDNLYRYLNHQHVKSLRPTEADMCYGAIAPEVDQHTMEILEVGLAFWRLYLIDWIKSRLTICLMREVMNRLEISAQQNYISPCLSSLMRVGELRDFERAGMEIYNEIFQTPLIEATRSYYSQWACQRESTIECYQYVTEALALRTDEQARALQYYKCSLEPIQILFEEIIVKERLHYLNQNVKHIMANEDKTNLRNLFQLLSPNNLCSELLQGFGDHVKMSIIEKISTLPQDLSTAHIQFIENLLDLRTRFLTFINEVFDGMSSFKNQLDKTFNIIINGRHSNSSALAEKGVKFNNLRPSELLCKYMDSLLRKSARCMMNSQIETKLISSMTIFKFLDDKDIFHKTVLSMFEAALLKQPNESVRDPLQYYQRMLCKRLLFNNSSLLELEECVIGQFKSVCGYEFTSKFQRMFNDIQLSPEINRNFAEYTDTKGIHFKFGYHFHVLTQCSWPISMNNISDIILPSELQTCTATFESFYSSIHHGRKIHWAHNYSTVELVLLFTDKSYQLQVPAVHAAIILTFDTLNQDKIRIRDLHERLQFIISEISSTNTKAVIGKISDNENKTNSGSNSGAAKNESVNILSTDPSGSGASNSSSTPSQPSSSSSLEIEQMKRLLQPLVELNLFYLESQEDQSVASSSNNVSNMTMDQFITLNRLFSNKHLKLRIKLSNQNKETLQLQEDQIDKQVNDDRRCFIQAAIVRILKTRKQIKHSNLIEEIVKQSTNRFQPSIPLVKRCIESLIETGYLERNPDDPDHYSYLA